MVKFTEKQIKLNKEISVMKKQWQFDENDNLNEYFNEFSLTNFSSPLLLVNEFLNTFR